MHARHSPRGFGTDVAQQSVCKRAADEASMQRFRKRQIVDEGRAAA
jgi:hypothetical protein